MKCCVKAIPMAALAFGCAGCICNHVAWVEGRTPELSSKLNADYRFVGEAGAEEAAKTLNQISHQSGEHFDMSITYTKGNAGSSLGGAAMINNFFAVCTLGIWPYISSQDQECSITVSGYDISQTKKFILGHRAWASFILPICALPCPGWGDWRSSASLSMEYGKGPGQEKWESEIVAGYVSEMLTEQFKKNVALGKSKNQADVAEGIKKLRAALEKMENQ